jgi:hypothetical protein
MMGAYNRDVSRRKALRKKRITEHYYWHRNGEPYYDNLHQFSKNKIHCSCPMCSQKTKNKGKRKRKNYNPTHNYKASDLRRKTLMDYDEAETLGF